MTPSTKEKLSFMRDIAQEFILKVLFPLLEKAELYHKSWAGHGRLVTDLLEGRLPSLVKEGWRRPSTKCREATIAGAAGVVC